MFGYLNFMLYLLLAIPACIQNQNKNSTPLNISISIPEQGVPIEPLVYGVSTSSMYWQTDATTTKFTSLVDSLHMNVLRWPGGTLAQFYHWNKAGYGLNQGEIKSIHPGYAENLQKQNAYVDEKSNSTHYIDDFVSLALQSHSKVLVCANLVTADDNETISLLKYFKSKNVPVCGVELGNELYLPRMRGVFNNDVRQYIARAKALVQKIKQEYPNMPVAVCGAPIRDIADENPPSGSEAAYFADWNQQLAKENFYDAVVLHFYFPLDCSGSVNSMFDCALDEIQNITGYTFPTSINMYRDVFGKSRSFWITEWNLATKSTEGRYGNTLLLNMFISRFYDAINVINNKNEHQITIATYQTLAGDIYGTCMIMDKTERETYTDLAADPYIRKTPYYAHQLIQPIFNSNTILCDVKSNKKDLYCTAYYDRLTKKLTIYFQNTSNEPFKINSLTVNDKSIPMQTNTTIHCLQSSNLYDGFGINKADGKLNNQGTPTVLMLKSSLNSINISNYSCGYLQVPL